MFAHDGQNGIIFDTALGNFEIPLQATRGYTLRGDNPTLLRWIANALRRNGIAATGDAGTIIANTPTDITLTSQHTTHCTSIAELLAAITQ